MRRGNEANPIRSVRNTRRREPVARSPQQASKLAFAHARHSMMQSRSHGSTRSLSGRVGRPAVRPRQAAARTGLPCRQKPARGATVAPRAVDMFVEEETTISTFQVRLYPSLPHRRPAPRLTRLSSLDHPSLPRRSCRHRRGNRRPVVLLEPDGGIRGQAQHPAVLRVRRNGRSGVPLLRRNGRNDDDDGKRGTPDGRLRQLLWRGQDRLHHLQRYGDRAKVSGQEGVRGRRLSGAPRLVALDGRVAAREIGASEH